MRRSQLRILGFVVAAIGLGLVFAPRAVADALGRPADTASRLINLRASWGGTLLGLGLFAAWLPAWRPWPRTVAGLVAWTMAGIGMARLVGFVLDGAADSRQLVWIVAEAILVIAGAVALGVLADREARR